MQSFGYMPLVYNVGGEDVTRYVIRRILAMIPILFAITIIIFVLAKLAPGDPFSGEPNPKAIQAQIDKKYEMWGLNDPIHEQYLSWLVKVSKGDFGKSFRYKRPVNDLLKERFGNTLFLGAYALFITLVISIPFGILSARRPYSLVDYTGNTLSTAGLAIPNFYLGLLLIFVFAIKLQWFPSQGSVTAQAQYTGFQLFLDKLKHFTLPAFTVGTSGTVVYFRYLRSEILEVMGKDFIRTARSKGVPERVVMYKHTLRNALIPVITLLGFELANLVSGAIITEQIFSIPGLGRLFFESIANRDYPIIMATGLISAVAILMGNLLADIFYSIADPRIRYD